MQNGFTRKECRFRGFVPSLASTGNCNSAAISFCNSAAIGSIVHHFFNDSEPSRRPSRSRSRRRGLSQKGASRPLQNNNKSVMALPILRKNEQELTPNVNKQEPSKGVPREQVGSTRESLS